MGYSRKRLNMIRKGQVVYVVTKNGADLFTYDNFTAAMFALTNFMDSDKVSKYDLVIRPKDSNAAAVK